MLFLVKKLGARKWQIFIDTLGLVEPKISIKSWAKAAIVESNFQEIKLDVNAISDDIKKQNKD